MSLLDTTNVQLESLEKPQTSGIDDPSPPGSSLDGSSTIPVLLLVLLVVLAAIVRFIATQNDLWLDELISVRIANALKTPWQIFTGVHSGNNHHMNTLYLYFVRNAKYPPVFRYASVLWGVALVPAGYWLLARRSRVEALILSGLLACSYPLIHFSSEARGYAGAVLGSTLACAALTRWLACDNEGRRSSLLGLTYGLSISFALLSHFTACLIWLPLAVGSLLVLARQPRPQNSIVLWMGINLVPATVLAALYSLDRQFLSQLGGPPMPALHGFLRLLANGLGWPASDTTTIWIVVVPLIGFALWQWETERRAGEPLAILLLFVYLMPVVCLFVSTPFFYPRYFLTILPFVYVMLAILLARLFRTRLGRVAFTALFALFLAGEAHLYLRFLQVGRGQFTAALQYIGAHSFSQRITIASNQDFRSTVELPFFVTGVLAGREVLYVQRISPLDAQTDWYILHEEGYDSPGPSHLGQPGQPIWDRAAYFGASELSGQAWTIYSRHSNQ